MTLMHTELDSFALFAPLTAEERTRLARHFRERSFGKLEMIYDEDTPVRAVFLIKDGWVELTRSSGEQDRIFRIATLKPGDIFGIGEIHIGKYFLTATALTRCTLLELSREHFLDDYLSIPALTEHLIRTLATVVRQRILMLDWDHADCKLVYFIYFLAERYGEEEGPKIVIRKKITQEQIAEILGLSREHVVRLFRRLEDQDYLYRTGNRMIVSKPWLDSRIIDKSFATTIKRSFFSELDSQGSSSP